MTAAPKVDVFISSTCYDLLDLRAELRRFLTENGFLVRLSDDPMSSFSVAPTSDSIESCLANVEAADLVVCVIDRRYGGVLKDGPHKGKSATHAEIDHARQLSPPKPVFFFMRDRAASDFAFIRDNDVQGKTRWVEPENDNQRQLWFRFVQSVSQLPKHENWSNWYDSFKDVVELKSLVLKRLLDQFPKQTIALALSPDRLVRLTFLPGKGGSTVSTIYGTFRNVGVGPAVNLVYGWAKSSLGNSEEKDRRGGLAEKESLSDLEHGVPYTVPRPAKEAVVFCDYQNRFGDCYRVEQTFAKQSDNDSFEASGGERLFVRMPDSEQWVEV